MTDLQLAQAIAAIIVAGQTDPTLAGAAWSAGRR